MARRTESLAHCTVLNFKSEKSGYRTAQHECGLRDGSAATRRAIGV